MALKKNGGNPWPPEDVAKAIGLSHRTTRFFYLTAAARDYGLTEGTRDAAQISLTPLGNAVVSLLPIAQLASVTGVYGLSWFLATLHALIAAVVVTHGRRRVSAGAAAMALLAACSFWGALRLRDGSLTTAGTPLRVALIIRPGASMPAWQGAEAPWLHQVQRGNAAADTGGCQAIPSAFHCTGSREQMSEFGLLVIA